MKFSDLEYLAFEGGGGKGAVYKGALVALEELFEREWQGGASVKIVNGQLTNFSEAKLPANEPAIQGVNKEEASGSILNYYTHGTLRIKGIAGSSAGAITAFPLALGLSARDIDEILTKFQFSKEFLPNHKLNEGKYRMVGMDRDGKATLLIAEDHFKKLGSDKLLHYQFSQRFKQSSLLANQNKDFIGNNLVKSWIRSAVVATVFSIVFTGLKENWPLVSRIVAAIAKFIDNYNYLKRWSVWLKSNVIQQQLSQVTGNPTLSKLLAAGIPVPWNLALRQILRLKYLNRLPWGSKTQLKLLDLLPADNLVGALGNVIWDRGIYAGFEVRELFFKIMLKALSKDTHFKRGLVERTALLTSAGLTRIEIENLRISFDEDYEVVAGGAPGVTAPDAQGATAGDASSATTPIDARKSVIKLGQLAEKLTFREFHEITKINLSICVTNASTSQPLYFSHYFTPDFPVLEAVGASMNFPIAFKPTYNEANVLLFDEGADKAKKDSVDNRTFLNPSDFVKFEPHQPDKRFYKESFTMRDFNRHLGVVLNYIKKTRKLSISTNGNLSFRSFLPYLREIIENDAFQPYEVKDHVHNRYESYDSGYMRSLCYFYYNSAFKGLLIDGGATNNLPMSIFTLEIPAGGSTDVQNLNIKKKVLGLKLDNSFPEVIKQTAFDLLKRDKGGKTLERLSNWEDKVAHYTFASKLFKDRKIRRAFERNKASTTLDEAAWVKVSKELVAEYQGTIGGFTPWNRQVGVVSAAMGPLQFGFDQGQIESIDDNENIIPLYCFGIGTLDFDLKEMEPLVKMAVKESEQAVMTYFCNEQSTKQQ